MNNRVLRILEYHKIIDIKERVCQKSLTAENLSAILMEVEIYWRSERLTAQVVSITTPRLQQKGKDGHEGREKK